MVVENKGNERRNKEYRDIGREESLNHGIFHGGTLRRRLDDNGITLCAQVWARQQNGVGDKQSLGRISLGTKLFSSQRVNLPILGRTSNEMSSRFMGLPRD
ncbi:hypothetical protein V1478_005457 [Vespula squamosa]|uniref:Uncharacterized protein n=1 Tax=Vespula squamosa TaxID=30214 RepID=A0ABD2BE76_VESSQ